MGGPGTLCWTLLPLELLPLRSVFPSVFPSAYRRASLARPDTVFHTLHGKPSAGLIENREIRENRPKSATPSLLLSSKALPNTVKQLLLATSYAARNLRARALSAQPVSLPSAPHRTSRGGLEAVRDGWASIVVEPKDVVRQLESAGSLLRGALEAAGETDTSLEDRAVRRQGITTEQSTIVEIIRDAHSAVDVDRLIALSGLSADRILSDLTELEITGRVRREAGGFVSG